MPIISKDALPKKDLNSLGILGIQENINVLEITLNSDDVVINQDKLLGNTRIVIRTPGEICFQVTGEYDHTDNEDVFYVKEVE
jgi:hypothetical protein